MTYTPLGLTAPTELFAIVAVATTLVVIVCIAGLKQGSKLGKPKVLPHYKEMEATASSLQAVRPPREPVVLQAYHSHQYNSWCIYSTRASELTMKVLASGYASYDDAVANFKEFSGENNV